MFNMKRAQVEEPRHDEAAVSPDSKSGLPEPAAKPGPARPGLKALKSPGAEALKSKVRPALTPKRRSTPPPDGATIRQQFEAVKRYAAEPSAGIFPQSRRSAAEEPSRLLIGRDISFKGQIGDCETLIVEGKVAANAKCHTLQVQEAGVYDGEIAVETAEICGRVEGRLQVRGRLTIRAAGQVNGDVTYGELDIAAGGRLAGNIHHEPIPDATAKDETAKDATAKDATAKDETAKDAAPKDMAVATEPVRPAQPIAARISQDAPPVEAAAPPAPPVPSDIESEARPPAPVAAAASKARDVVASKQTAPVAVGTAGERP